MNEILKEQLKELKYVHITEDQLEIHISKVDLENRHTFKLGARYIIKFEDYIVTPPANFNLHINWNNNIKPTSLYMNIKIVKVLGKMLQVEGWNIDPITYAKLPGTWQGWCPQSSIIKLKEVQDAEFSC